MGTHKSIAIDANTNNKEILDGIKKILEKHKAEDCFRTNLVDVGKWWPDELIKELVDAYPKVMFRIDSSLDRYPIFYLGETEIYGSWVQDTFPSINRFKNGVKKNNVHISKLKREKEKKELAIKKEKEKQQKQKELAELERLKNKYEKK